MNRTPHDFAASLKRSHESHSLPIWEQMYRQAFHSMVAMHDHRENGYWQAAGIDRSIVLQSSKQILVDEKIRGRNRDTGIVYRDIAIEHVGNNRTKAPGWAEKTLAADYIAYAIAPIGLGYLLPVPQFQAAWKTNKEDWLSRYGFRSSPNNGYDTLFCPVPVPVLFQAMGKQFRLTFDPIEWVE